MNYKVESVYHEYSYSDEKSSQIILTFETNPKMVFCLDEASQIPISDWEEILNVVKTGLDSDDICHQKNYEAMGSNLEIEICNDTFTMYINTECKGNPSVTLQFSRKESLPLIEDILKHVKECKEWEETGEFNEDNSSFEFTA